MASETYTDMQSFIMQISGIYRLEYGYILKDLDKITRKTAKEMAEAVKENSPVKTGRYASGWTTTSKRSKSGELEMVVYNKDRYQLTHLLENDHFGGRDLHIVKGNPHIEPVEEKFNKLYIERIEKAFGVYGG